MDRLRPTIWETMQAKGYSRRDFMRLCGIAAMTAGFELSAVGKVAEAFETKSRPPIIWLHFQECTCCSESFLRSGHPIVADILLDTVSLNYTETLQAASGHQAEKCLEDTIKNYPGEYILMVEGAVPVADGGVYCMIGGRTAIEILEECAHDAKAIIAWGSCAANGCVQAAHPNPTGATPIHELLHQPVIKVPGCPPIGDVMAAVVTHMVVTGKAPELDSLGRPREFYGRRIHDTCYRRPNYDAGLFVESFDDENANKGYCLYKLGCRGPITYNACAVTKWNEGVSFPIQSGHGCIGCSEEGFWDNGPFYQHLPHFPGFGIESTADAIGVAATAVTVASVGAHAVATNIRKKKLIDEIIADRKNDTDDQE